jgi:hypothetical protein
MLRGSLSLNQKSATKIAYDIHTDLLRKEKQSTSTYQHLSKLEGKLQVTDQGLLPVKRNCTTRGHTSYDPSSETLFQYSLVTDVDQGDGSSCGVVSFLRELAFYGNLNLASFVPKDREEKKRWLLQMRYSFLNMILSPDKINASTLRKVGPQYNHIPSLQFSQGMRAQMKAQRTKRFDVNPCECAIVCGTQCYNFVSKICCNESNCRIFQQKLYCNNCPLADDFFMPDSAFNIILEGTKGWGLKNSVVIPPNRILQEYAGLVHEFPKPNGAPFDSQYKIKTSQYYIDASDVGNLMRFINEDKENPKCQFEEWLVNGMPRIFVVSGDLAIEVSEDPKDTLSVSYNDHAFVYKLHL